MPRNIATAFSVSMFLLLSTSAFAQTLNATATLQVTPQGGWTYTLNNNEAVTNDNWLTSFYLPINAPVSNVVAPSNWIIDTDDATYILWSNQEAYPYPDDVAPETALSGFTFNSQAPGAEVSSVVSSWNHATDDTGPNVMLQILSPNSPPAVPEASTWQSLGALLLLGGLLVVRRPHGKHG